MNHLKEDAGPARARKEELVVQELPDEVLVYDLRNHKAHCLNPTAAFVWNHCDGRMTAADIAALMAAEWEKPVNEEVVWLALKQLSRANLLIEPVKTVDGTRTSRRAVLRRLGASAAMTPLVISLVAPMASAGSSVPPQCVPCTSFGSGANRKNNCPDICNATAGRCFNNASCSTGQGGLLATNIGCSDCFNNFPQSSGWRAP